MTKAMARAVELHSRLSKAFLETAEAVSAERWERPWSDGKWTPGEIAAHLVSVYEILTRELRGGEGMRIVLPWWGRILAKVMALWRIVYFGTFPSAARAPRELRPAAGLQRDEALTRFRAAASEFEEAAVAAAPDAKSTHAYFGRGPAVRGVIVASRHIEHHRRQLAAIRAD